MRRKVDTDFIDRDLRLNPMLAREFLEAIQSLSIWQRFLLWMNHHMRRIF